MQPYSTDPRRWDRAPDDELLRHQPAHDAERQLEAIPDEAEEQRADLPEVISEPHLS